MTAISPHERALAILATGLVAAITAACLIIAASAVFLIGKGGLAAFESLAQWTSESVELR